MNLYKIYAIRLMKEQVVKNDVPEFVVAIV
jgi:hypothetical protein